MATVSETGAVGGKKITIEQFFAIEKQLKEKFEKGEIDRDEFNDSYDRLKCLYEKSENSAEVGSTASSESTKGGSDATKGTRSTQSVLNAGSKADALKAVDDLPSNIQSNVKSFFKGGSNKYTDFTVEKMPNGNYMAKMTKPGDVPGSKAIYYKEISLDGTTIKVYKDTFDPAGNLVHTKPK